MKQLPMVTCSLSLLLLSCLATTAAGAEPVVERIDGVPDELAEPLAAVVDPEGYRIVDGDRVLAELWLRRELPLEGTQLGALGIEYGDMTASGLVGVVRFPEPWIDYRDTDVEPGLYTLRYWIQPADGDHMGVAQYRDFLLLLPAEDDTDPETLYEEDPLLELGQKASGRVHPSVLALFPVWEEPSGEAEIRMNEIDQPMLVATVGDRALGLVVEGHGELP